MEGRAGGGGDELKVLFTLKSWFHVSGIGFNTKFHLLWIILWFLFQVKI